MRRSSALFDSDRISGSSDGLSGLPASQPHRQASPSCIDMTWSSKVARRVHVLKPIVQTYWDIMRFSGSRRTCGGAAGSPRIDLRLVTPGPSQSSPLRRGECLIWPRAALHVTRLGHIFDLAALARCLALKTVLLILRYRDARGPAEGVSGILTALISCHHDDVDELQTDVPKAARARCPASGPQVHGGAHGAGAISLSRRRPQSPAARISVQVRRSVSAAGSRRPTPPSEASIRPRTRPRTASVQAAPCAVRGS